MLQNAYFLAKIGADTAENERNFALNLPDPARVIVPAPDQDREGYAVDAWKRFGKCARLSSGG